MTRGLRSDPRRIVLAGGSTRGQLAVSVTYRAATGTQASSCGGRALVELPYVDRTFDAVDRSLGQQVTNSIVRRWITARIA